MTPRVPAAAGLLLAASIPFLAPAGSPLQEAVQEEAQGETVDPDEILIESMEVIEDGMKALRKQLSKPDQYPAALELVISMQQAAMTCKLIPPPMTIGLPEEERPTFVLAYRKDMIAMQQAMLAFELALLEGEPEAVKESYKALRDLEEPAHEQFTEG